MKKSASIFIILICAILQNLAAQIPTYYIDGKPSIKYTHTCDYVSPIMRLNVEVGFQFTCPVLESKTDRVRYEIRCESPGLIVRADSLKPGYFYFTATQQCEKLYFSVLFYADKPFKYVPTYAKDKNKPLFDANGKVIRSNATFHDPVLIGEERMQIDRVLSRMYSAKKEKAAGQ